VKNPFENLDKVLEHGTRLQIMSMLLMHDAVDFNTFKEELNLSDGSLASHMKALEREEYIAVAKSFVERKPKTKYKITPQGRLAFKKHIDALEAVVKQQRE
jgi:DNA-binding HxlR family transcriptional regulator